MDPGSAAQHVPASTSKRADGNVVSAPAQTQRDLLDLAPLRLGKVLVIAGGFWRSGQPLEQVLGVGH